MAERADDLIIEGRIATLGGPSGFGWVQAIAIRDGRVAAAGTVSEAEAAVGAAAARWRLAADHIVTPSLTDAHLHLTTAAIAADQPDLNGLDRAGVVETVTRVHDERSATGDTDSWLLAYGWSLDALRERPDAGWLDDAAPGRPVALWSHDHHARWLSSRAVQLGGLAAVADPADGRIERHEDGRPTGVMVEGAAGLIDEVIPPITANDVDWAVGAYARTLASFGITSVHDPGGLSPEPALSGGPIVYRDLALGGHLPLRVVASVREEQLPRAIEAGFRSGRAEAEPGSGRYRDGWLKIFADGALGSRTAALLEPYEADDPAGPPVGGVRGMPRHTPEELIALGERAAAAGIACQIHAIGDGAVRTALDALGRVPTVPGAMHRIEHAQLVHAAEIARFAATGVAASVQPGHLISDAAAIRVAWGDRSAAAFSLAALEAAHSLIPFGSDAPVESADPWRGIAIAVTRRAPGRAPEEPFHEEQALGLERALRAACLDGPRSAGIADQGHLMPGARADLVVLPSSLVDDRPDPTTIATVRPVATVLDGQLIHETQDFAP